MLGVLAVALLGAGCGSGSSIKSQPPSGRALFASSCGGCHTLTGVDSPTHQGGDLLHVALTRAQLRQFTREMPVRRPLSAAELDAVTSYVLAVQGRH